MAPVKKNSKKAAVAAPVVEEAPEIKAMTELVAKLSLGAERAPTAAQIAKTFKDGGAKALKANNLWDKVKEATNSTDAATREGAVVAIAELRKVGGTDFEPLAVDALPELLDRLSDKVAGVADLAKTVVAEIMASVKPNAIKTVLPALLGAQDHKKGWQTKAGALNAIGDLATMAPKHLALNLPDIIPVVSGTISDAKPQVKTAAADTMGKVCTVVNNIDIEAVIPAIISCVAKPAEVPDCIHQLGATTFVQQVEAPTLAVLVPLLVRGLKERVTAIKRKSCLIIDNMCKLVDNPWDAIVFLPRLVPGVETVVKEVSDPECRTVAERALKTLQQVERDAQEQLEGRKAMDAEDITPILADLSKKEVDPTTLHFIASSCAQLCTARDWDVPDWEAVVVPYLSAFTGEAAAKDVAKATLAKCEKAQEEKPQELDDEEGEDLCNCEFSLGYGAKILMNNARMHLKRGKRYGLCGGNGTGKSTLMRSIANGQVENFPPKDQLRTVYVEHDIDGSLSELSVVEFIFSDPVLQDTTHPAHGEVEKVLESVGFDAERRAQAVAALSGGWKMKLALARAMLMKADILLLDEPTNHLDVKNVKWLEDYLCSLTEVTSILVSHDSAFLDHVCTHILHLENRKLRTYRGNLSEFVKKVPAAKSYYELGAQELTFRLPEPGFLEGVKTKDKAILKMHNVSFRYPGTEKDILNGVSIFCSLSSRVAVLGPNGAGKSTMIKVLTGEMKPTTGSVWKHPNLRIAYVAQHAFHHLEQHLDKTPNEYIQWRYATGEDREDVEKINRKLDEEEKKKLEAQIMVGGVKRVIDKLLNRRKLKKDYEYEVQWKGLAETEWMSRDLLEELGFDKLCNDMDMKEAAKAGLMAKPLTAANVSKHLDDVGIEPEFGSHSHIRGLSGGQKVKVVIGAAMWNNPHILVLDEPTNYLDRESLGALADAIREFGGGVVMISHNREFTSHLCKETWSMEEGKLVAEGQSADGQKTRLEYKPQEEVVDALGNIIKVKAPKKKMSRKELKAHKKAKEAKRARGEDVSDSEEEWE